MRKSLPSRLRRMLRALLGGVTAVCLALVHASQG